MNTFHETSTDEIIHKECFEKPIYWLTSTLQISETAGNIFSNNLTSPRQCRSETTTLFNLKLTNLRPETDYQNTKWKKLASDFFLLKLGVVFYRNRRNLYLLLWKEVMTWNDDNGCIRGGFRLFISLRFVDKMVWLGCWFGENKQ